MKIILTKQEIIKGLNLPENCDIEINPEKQDKVDEFWTITDPHNVKTSELIKQARELFKVYIYDEKDIDKQFPAPKKDIIVSFRKSYEPDKEHLGKSYIRCIDEGIPVITLRQYFILAMKVFKEEGKHLDTIGWTIGAPRAVDGDVPNMYWDPSYDTVFVYYRGVDRYDSSGGVRQQFYL